MPLKVLYLDDEIDLADIFSDTFSSDDVKIETFTHPGKAIAAATANRPDVIFIDYRLPATTGDLVALEMDPTIPKYLITGDISVETTYKFVKIFSKPYNSEDILRVLDEHKKK